MVTELLVCYLTRGRSRPVVKGGGGAPGYRAPQKKVVVPPSSTAAGSGVDADSMLMSSELSVAKAFISKEFKPDEHLCVGDVCSLLYPMQTAFPSVFQLFAAAATFSATFEASFSALSRVLTAYRRSMTHERKRNFVILAFLQSYTKNVYMEEVLRCFSKKSRKLQLF